MTHHSKQPLKVFAMKATNCGVAIRSLFSSIFAQISLVFCAATKEDIINCLRLNSCTLSALSSNWAAPKELVMLRLVKHCQNDQFQVKIPSGEPIFRFFLQSAP